MEKKYRWRSNFKQACTFGLEARSAIRRDATKKPLIEDQHIEVEIAVFGSISRHNKQPLKPK